MHFPHATEAFLTHFLHSFVGPVPSSLPVGNEKRHPDAEWRRFPALGPEGCDQALRASLRALTLSVFSQVKLFSVRPKWPPAAVAR